MAGLNVRVLPFSIWFFVQPVRAALLKIDSHLADVKEVELPPQLIVSALAWLAAMADDVRHAKDKMIEVIGGAAKGVHGRTANGRYCTVLGEPAGWRSEFT